jgi:cold shock CspA family protein
LKPTPKPSTTGSNKPAPATTKAPLAIKPSPEGSKAKVQIENLKPGQKIKITVKEGESMATPKPSVKPSTRPTVKPSTNSTPKPKNTEPVKIVPKPSGSSANFGINNLKPGQKIKVTVKTGGNKK